MNELHLSRRVTLPQGNIFLQNQARQEHIEIKDALKENYTPLTAGQ